MKKLFTIILATLLLAATDIQAQNGSLTLSKSSLTNVDTATASLPSTRAYYASISASALITRSSGTLAGSVNLQASNDNTNWATISTTSLTNAATFPIVFQHAPAGFNYYRLQFITSGTVAATLSAGKYTLKGRK